MLTLYCTMNFPLLCESLTCKSWFYPLWNLFSFFSLVKKRRKLVKERRRCPVLSRKNHLKVQFFFFERNHHSFHHCIAKYMFEFFDRSENIFQFKLYFFSTDSKLTQLDFSIPKAPVSVQVQSGFRKVEPSSKRKELSTDDIDSKDQCATQWMDSHFMGVMSPPV